MFEASKDFTLTREVPRRRLCMLLSSLLLGRKEKFGEISNELYNSPCYSFVKLASNKHLTDTD